MIHRKYVGSCVILGFCAYVGLLYLSKLMAEPLHRKYSRNKGYVESRYLKESESYSINILNVSSSKTARKRSSTDSESYSRNMLNIRSSKTAKKPLCNFEFLRSYAQIHHSVPAKGTWETPLHNKSFFHPEDCVFRHGVDLPPDYLEQCFSRNKISSIMIIGDSNAGNAYKSMAGKFSSCGKIKTYPEPLKTAKMDGPVPDVLSHLGNEKFWGRFSGMFPNKRNCSLWGTSHRVCWNSDQANVSLHYVVVSCMKNSKPNETHIADPNKEPYVQVIHKVKPDVIFYFYPFAHEKEAPLEFIRRKFQFLRILTEKYFPPKTKLVVIPGFSESEEARARNAKSQRYRNLHYFGLLATDYIDAMNKVMFDVLENAVASTDGKIFTIMDLMYMSRLVADKWSVDGVHMKGVWYDVETSVILQTLCNSMWA